jgi:S-adenosylmethionine:tRNA ribosyltransferase-isomerase
VTPAAAAGLAATLDFELPPGLEASAPPEARGLRRDDVRLLVTWRSTGAVDHRRFRDLPDVLAPGDLLVVNTSRTLPAAVDGRHADGSPVVVHLSTDLGAGRWVVELRMPAGRGATVPCGCGRAGERLDLAGGATAELLAPYLPSGPRPRLWVADLRTPGPALAWLEANGRPIRYGYVPEPWPIDAYQNVYALVPGSAEMPSAGRAFTPELVTRLVAGGVAVAPIVLHTGVASLEAGEAPYPEPYTVPPATARLVNATRDGGGRVVAVGTTVVRALETVAGPDGTVVPGEGWTDVVVTPERGVRAVDGLLTGLHEPRASHLAMLEAVAGRPVLERAYAEALAGGYLWHEFGDLHLILP